MQFEILIPIVLFICIFAAIKAVVDARVRSRMAEAHASEELVRAMLLADEQSRRVAALKWGIVLVVVGVAFGAIDLLGLRADAPGTWGLLLGAAGAGMLLFHGIAARKG